MLEAVKVNDLTFGERIGSVLFPTSVIAGFAAVVLGLAAHASAAPPASEAKAPSSTEKPAPTPSAKPDPEPPAEQAMPPAADAPKAEPRLRFNFRFQKWVDVLEWFAEQADLSLVLDAPPPGTFNYSDRREYSVVESIDLLNGVLLSKGFTLIRRDRMLVVVNLAQGIPDNLVPRVTLEELEKRGNNEFVTVQFSVGNRDPESVVKEISPLLGKHGKSTMLALTRQVVVTDTAGVMRAVGVVIESIPQPPVRPAPPPPPAPAPPEASVVAVYPIRAADPKTAVEVIKTMFPTLPLALDAKADQINVLAPPSQQAVIKSILDRMEATNPPEKHPRLETYAVDDPNPTALVAALQPLVPNVRMTFDAATSKVVAFGAPDELQTLQDALRRLSRQATDAGLSTAEVYRLGQFDSATTLTLLQGLVPRAKLSLDAPTRSLVAVASARDHELIAQTLAKLRPEKPDPQNESLQVYPTKEAPSASFVTMLQTFVPKAQIVADPDSKQLLVLAAPWDHATLKAVLDRILAAMPPDEKKRLEVYPVTPAERKRFNAVLDAVTAELPGIRVISDAEPGELSIWAKPSQHETIRQLLAQLKHDVAADEKYQVVVYPIHAADPASVQTVLQSLLPGTQLVLDAKSRRITVWAAPAVQAVVKSTIDQMDVASPEGTKRQLMSYPVRGIDPATLLSALKELAPDATLVGDAKAEAVVAFASKADHAAIGDALRRFESGRSDVGQTRLAIHTLRGSGAAGLVAAIGPLVPTARLTASSDGSRLIAVAREEDLALIRAAVEQVEASDLPAGTGVLAVYPLKGIPAAPLVPILDSLGLNGAKYSADAAGQNLLVWAEPGQQDSIRKVISDAQQKVPQRTAQAYRLRSVDPQAALTALATLAPSAQITLDARNRGLVVSAFAEDHAKIKATLDEMDSDDRPEDGLQLRSHSLGNADATSLLTLLRGLFAQRPEVQLSVDPNTKKLMALANASQHDTIQKLIAEADVGADATDAMQMKSYPLRGADPASVKQVLTTLLERDGAKVELTLDSSGQQLIVVATSRQQRLAESAIEQLAGEDAEVEVLRLEVLEADVAANAARSLFDSQGVGGKATGPRINADAALQQIVVHGTKGQISLVRSLLTKMGETELDRSGGRDRRTLRVVPFSGDAPAAIAEIQRIWPLLRKNSLLVAPSIDEHPRLPAVPPRATEPADDPPLDRDNEAPADPRASSAVPPVRFHNPTLTAGRLHGPRGYLVAAALTRTQEDDAPPTGGSFPPNSRPNPSPADVSVTALGVESDRTDEPDAGASGESSPPSKESARPLPADSLPPVIIAPREGAVAMSSDDLDALDQLESLLRALSLQSDRQVGNYLIRPLKNAAARDVAETIRQLFRDDSASGRGAGAGPVVVPDDRLNAVVVHASRSERAAIAALIEVLDSGVAIDSLTAMKPKLIPVRNTKASRIEAVVRDVYKAQLAAASGRTPLPVPANTPPQLAALIQQINASNAGPALTMSVDEGVNALVVMAPTPLLAEVSQLVETLDGAAASKDYHALRVVPLRTTSSKQMQEALNAVLKERARRDSRP